MLTKLKENFGEAEFYNENGKKNLNMLETGFFLP